MSSYQPGEAKEWAKSNVHGIYVALYAPMQWPKDHSIQGDSVF